MLLGSLFQVFISVCKIILKISSISVFGSFKVISWREEGGSGISVRPPSGGGGLANVSADTLKKLMLKQMCNFKQKRGNNWEKNIIQAKKSEAVEDVMTYYS